MRVTVVLLFALMALAFVVAYAADEVSVYANIARKMVEIVTSS